MEDRQIVQLYWDRSEDAIPAMLGFRCDACCEHFLRGIFLCAGTVNDPAKSYHL